VDLLRISRILRRHKLLTFPVVILTVLGMGYALVGTKPLYQSTADYLLSPPPSAPTPGQLAADPSLAKANYDNVYARLPDLSVVVDIVAAKITGTAESQALLAQGADPRFSIAPVEKYGSPTPILEVTGTGSTAAEALKTRELVSAASIRDLYSMQASQGTSPFYMINALPMATTSPRLKVSSKLRDVIAVVALGGFLLFLAVSIGDAIDKKRAERGAAGEPKEVAHGAASEMRETMPVEIQPIQQKEDSSGIWANLGGRDEGALTAARAPASGE
jgi:hypothetical protein